MKWLPLSFRLRNTAWRRLPIRPFRQPVDFGGLRAIYKQCHKRTPIAQLGSQSGTVFLEIVISVGVLAMLLGAIANLVVASYNAVGFSKTRITARHLATEKIELIRNLPFNDVAVLGGVPPGNLPQLETLSRNGLNYTVKTNVVYVDDPFDGLAPSDTLPIDYKRVRVDVSWTGTFTSNSTVTMITDVAPKGIESVGQGGTLSILVFDANALPVSGAQVRIQNTIVNPAIDLTVNTDSNGRVILPGSPVCFECYQIDVTKTGYSSDRTYSVAEVAHPEKPLATIVDQTLTEISFAIDLVSTLEITSTQGRDQGYASLSNQFFQLTGTKEIGTDTLESPVYKYDQLLQTDGSGSLTVNDLEWDTYALAVPAGTWDVAGVNPFSPFVLLPNTTLSMSFASVAHADNTLLFQVTDASGSAIPQALLHVTDTGSYDEALLTAGSGLPDFGQAFFSPLSVGTHNVEATKIGYQPETVQIEVGGNMVESIIMIESIGGEGGDPPIGWWNFNENTGQIAFDTSGSGSDGTLGSTTGVDSSDPSWVTVTDAPPGAVGLEGSALSFDGGDYVDMNSQAVLNFDDTADFTIQAWFYRDTENSTDIIVAKRTGTAPSDIGYILLITDATDVLTFEVSDGNDEFEITGTTTFTTPGWNQVVVVFDQDSATNSTIYVNGVDDKASVTGVIGNVGDISNAFDFRIGASPPSGAPFEGRIDDVRVYDYVRVPQ